MNFQAPPTHAQVSDLFVATTELLLGNELESLNYQAPPLVDNLLQTGQTLQQTLYSCPFTNDPIQDNIFQCNLSFNANCLYPALQTFNSNLVSVTALPLDVSTQQVPAVQALPASQPPEVNDKLITETGIICTNCNSLYQGKRSYSHQKTKKPVCQKCNDYYRLVGKDRPPHLWAKKPVECSNCKSTIKRRSYHPVTKGAICEPCAKYRYRYGRDRPADGFPPPNKTLPCTHCKLPKMQRTRRHPKTRELVCAPCARYYIRHGVDRPSHSFSKK